MELSRVEHILKYFLGEADTLPQPLSRVEELLIALGELISSGAVSSPIKIKGRVDTVADLPSNAEPGWMYYVGPANASEFAEYVYLDTGEWQYTGTSNSAIDIALSTTSTNPVENRVITEAINLINQTLSDKVDKVTGKGLSTEDFTTEEKAKLSSIETGANANVQADWNQTDVTADDYIKNKPTIPDPVVVDQTYNAFSANAQSGTAVAGALDDKVDKVAGKGLSTEDFTTAEKAKLYNIESGAQANVQVDWNQTDTAADDYIKNKPDITFVQVNADWNATSGVAQILNKPNIPEGVVVDLVYDPTSEHAQAGVAVAEAISNKVDKVNGKGLSTNDFTDNDKTKLDSIAANAEANVQSDWNQNDSTADDFIKNKPTITTANDAVLEIQKNGAKIGEFTANASTDAVVNITVPVNAVDVNALPASTKYGASLSLSIDNATYVITAALNDQDGNTLGMAQTIDLPLESVVVNGSYDDTTQKIILTLNNGNTVEFSVADLVSGLQTEITTTNKLDADLVDDSTSTNKFVTAADKTAWNAKSDFSGSYTDLTNVPEFATVATTGSYNDLTDKPVIPPGAAVDQTFDPASQNAQSGTAVAGAIAGKVDKVNGKGLSTNDYTDADKTKLDGVESGAQANVQADWNQTDSAADDFIKNKPNIPSGVVVDQVYDATSTNAQAGVAVAEAVSGKVDKVTGKGLSTEDFTTAEKTKLSNVESGAQANVQSDWTQNDSTADDFIKNKPTIPAAQVNSDWDAVSGVAQILNKPTLSTVATTGSYNDLSNKPTIPTVNNATLEIQKNSVKVGEFSADASSDVTVNITVPVDADDVNALPDTTKYAASIDVSINNTTYVMTTTLKDQDGNTLGTAQVVDLPLETMVVGGSYDDTTHKIILTLNNGTTVDFSVADLVSGLQSEITSTNKLDADLVDDSTSTNKFVTAADKTAWNAKSDFSGSYNDLTDKPTIPAAQVNADWNAVSGVAQILNKPTIPTPVTVDQTYDATSTNPQSGVAIAGVIGNINSVLEEVL